MNPEITKVVQQLADKLGVTAQYLCAAFVFIGVIAIYVGIQLVKYGFSEDADRYDNEPFYIISGVVFNYCRIGHVTRLHVRGNHGAVLSGVRSLD